MYPHIIKKYDVRLGPNPYVFNISDIKDKKYFRLNKDAADIVTMCDGTKNIDEIVKELSELNNKEYSTLFSIVKTFIDSQVFIDYSNEKIEIDKSRWGDFSIQKISHASIDLTEECNFRCKHCYNDSHPGKGIYQDTNKLLKVLDNLYDNGVAVVELTGGEPLLHPDFKIIIDHCLKLFDLVGIITNGFYLNEEILDYLTPFNEKLTFQVDLHGTKEYMDWFCEKEGAFDKVKNNIALLCERDFIIRIAMVMTKLNYTQIPDIVSIIKEMRQHYPSDSYLSETLTLAVSPFVPQGRGGLNTELISFDVSDFDNVNTILNEYAEKYSDFLFKLPQNFVEFLNNNANCGAGSKSISIGANGRIKLCPMADDSITFGNLYETKLDDILRKKDFTTYFIDLKPPNLEVCSECQHIGFCNECVVRGIIKYKEVNDECIWAIESKLCENVNLTF
ncbi:MAG: PqqD family peptide modification chaperone [Methanobrevibacter sp.]|nr:PqqD family peptide modification chaperone [Candidatus Methanovirga australis]